MTEEAAAARGWRTHLSGLCDTSSWTAIAGACCAAHNAFVCSVCWIFWISAASVAGAPIEGLHCRRRERPTAPEGGTETNCTRRLSSSWTTGGCMPWWQRRSGWTASYRAMLLACRCDSHCSNTIIACLPRSDAVDDVRHASFCERGSWAAVIDQRGCSVVCLLGLLSSWLRLHAEGGEPLCRRWRHL